jgi:hypothetical protein
MDVSVVVVLVETFSSDGDVLEVGGGSCVTMIKAGGSAWGISRPTNPVDRLHFQHNSESLKLSSATVMVFCS